MGVLTRLGDPLRGRSATGEPLSADRLLGQLTLVALAAVLLLGLSQGVRYGWAGALWYPQHILPLVALLWLSRWRPLAHLGVAVVAAYALVTPLLAMAVGMGRLNPAALFGWPADWRIVLYTENPNLIAADLTAAAFVAAVVVRRLPWVLWPMLSMVASIFIGTRTAILAHGAAVLVGTLLPGAAWRARALGVGAVGFLVFVLFFSDAYFATPRPTPNLLHHATAFGAGWVALGEGAELSVREADGRGPGLLTSAQQLELQGAEGDAALAYPLGLSREGALHAARVMLRAADPVTLTLSSGLSEVRCEVTRRWSECATAAALGDGVREAEFRLVGEASWRVEAARPSFTVEGESLTYTLPNPLGGMLWRFRPDRILSTAGDSRPEIYLLGWRTFLANPLLGAGQGWLERAPGWVLWRGNHAHNWLIETLAAEGLLGLTLWGALFAAFLRIVFLAFGWRALPWLAALVVLNTTDLTLFHMGPYWSAGILGVVAISRLRARDAAASGAPR